MKRLINKVVLKVFCDEATGDYGTAPIQCINSDDNFNSFWSGIGMFHDVFEHYFEMKHKYFMGDYGMNIGGEMAAMGHMWYYQNKLGVHNRRVESRSMYNDGDVMRMTTFDMVQESISEGYYSFGNILKCCIPNQRPLDNSEMEYQIEKFWDDIKVTYYRRGNTEDQESSKVYKDSVSFRKIADLHRWGFREAERRVPDTMDNQEVLSDFIDFWDKFTEENRAIDIYEMGGNLTFHIYKEDREISWKSYLGKHRIKDVYSEQFINY